MNVQEMENGGDSTRSFGGFYHLCLHLCLHVGLELAVRNSTTPPPTLERRGVREQLTHSKSPVARVRHSVKCGFCRHEGNTELLSHFTD